MKKLTFIFFFGTFICMTHAQIRPTYWGVTGNTGNTTTNYLGTTDCRPIIFKTKGIERMRLYENQTRLGIGIVDPQATLHLHYQPIDASSCDIIINPQDAVNNVLLRLTAPQTGTNSINGFSIAYSSTKDIIFKQQEQSNFLLEGPAGGIAIAPNGRVGIGTPTPHTTLDVVGDIATNQLWVNNYATTDWNYASGIFVTRDKTKAFSVHKRDSITGATQPVFVIYGNGVMSAKKIFTEKIEVTMSALEYYWYDHVFYPEYKLRPLGELEQFVKQNHHLPEIPSAAEVEANGLDLGDMQGKLLLKIEELTLYILDLQKQIDELKNK